MPARRPVQRQTRSKSIRRSPKNRMTPFLIFLLAAILLVMIILYVPPLFYLIPLIAGFLLLIGFLGWRFWPRGRAGRSRERVKETIPQNGTRPPMARYSLEHLLSLSPGQFEDFTGVVLEVIYHHTDVQRVGRSGDEGADLLARDEYGQRVVVQCKRFAPTNKVRSDAIQKLVGAMVHHDARGGGWLVTTSTFSSGVNKYMTRHYGRIHLLNGPDLTDLCQMHAAELDRVWFQRSRR